MGFYQNVLSELPHYAEYLIGTQAVLKEMPSYMSRGLTKGLYEQRGWVLGNAYLPHDGKVKEWGAGRTRVGQAIRFGLKAKLAAIQEKHDSINAARFTIPICDFDRAGCEPAGLKVLRNYQWEWDDKLGAWKTGTPLHDDNSHGADAFQTLATSWKEIVPQVDPKPAPKDLTYQVNAQGMLEMNMDLRSWVEMKRKQRLARG